MTTDVTAAIDALYAASADVPRPTTIEYCPCCFRPDDERELLAPVPLRRLPARALSAYAASALLTVGDVADFRYFLPRLLETLLVEGVDRPDLEVVGNRLRMAQWTSWPGPQPDAVRAVLAATWRRTLATDPDDGGDADQVLCTLGNAENDLAPYLAEWTWSLAMPAAAAQLRNFLRHGWRWRRGTRTLTNGFWDYRPDQATQVLAWLGGSPLRAAVSAAFSTAADSADPGQHEIAYALTEIDALLNAPPPLR